MLRLLYVTYSFPPMAGAGVHRPVKFVKHLESFGIKTTILTTTHDPIVAQDLSYAQEIPTSVEIQRVPNPNYSFVSRLLGRLGKKPKPTPIDAKWKWSREVATYIHQTCKHADSPPWDVVLVSAPPFSSFILSDGYPLPYVLDYRDEASTSGVTTNGFSQSQIQELAQLEASALKQAAGIITVFPSLRPRIAGVAKIPEDAISVVENGYDEDDFKDLPAQPSSEHFISTYAGYMYGSRTPEPWWRALKSIKESHPEISSQMEVRIYGRMALEFETLIPKLGIGDLVKCFGQVSHRDALKALSQAHQLVIISESIPEADDWPTGKIYENMRAGAPLLVTGTKGAVKDTLLRSCNAGQVVETDDIEAIKAEILAQFSSWKRGEWKRRPVADTLRQYERKALTEKLARVLHQAAAKA